MNFYSVSALLATITSLSLGVFIFLKDPKNFTNRIWAVFSLSIAIWSFGFFIMTGEFYNAKLTLFWDRISHIGAIMIPILVVHFLYSFFRARNKIILNIGYGVSLFLLLFVFTDLLLKDVTQKLSFKFYPNPGLLYPIFTIYFFLYVIYSSYLIIKIGVISDSGIRRNQAKYLLFASIIGFLGGASTFPLVYNIPLKPFGILPFAFYPILITYAIVKYRLMDINLAITRAGIFITVYAFVLGTPFWIGHQYGLWREATFITLILATLGPFIYTSLRRRAENRLLAEDLKKYDVLKRLTRTIGLVRDLDKIVLLIVYRLVKTLRISHAMIFLFDRQENSYVLKSMRRLNGIKMGFSDNISTDTDFIKFLLHWRKDLLYEDIQKLIQEPRPGNNKQNPEDNDIDLKKAATLMQAVNASLVIPHFLEKELIGFLVLGKKVSGKPYSEADIEVLTTLSRSASLQIMNAISMNELQKTERELAEATRLAHIGYVSSSIGHQIRNLLADINSVGMALLVNSTILDCFKDKPEAAAEFEKNINDIFEFTKDGSMIINELTEYSRPDADKEYELVSLREVLDRTLKVLYVQANKFQAIDIVINVTSDVPRVLGSFVSLQNVFINMFNNSYDAIQETKHYIETHPELGITNYKGRIEINVSRQKGGVHIHIIDNGKGIPADVQKRLFTPLYTTKASFNKRNQQKLTGGTGIGLYTILVIIKNHDGVIKLYNTEPMKGTDFLIELPVPKEKGA